MFYLFFYNPPNALLSKKALIFIRDIMGLSIFTTKQMTSVAVWIFACRAAITIFPIY